MASTFISTTWSRCLTIGENVIKLFFFLKY
jgi:hypothetical protein